MKTIFTFGYLFNAINVLAEESFKKRSTSFSASVFVISNESGSSLTLFGTDNDSENPFTAFFRKK